MRPSRVVLAVLPLVAVACADRSVRAPRPTAAQIPPAVRAAVDAPDRSGDDRALDAGRHPAELLAFYGVAPGMRVAELAAGRGYTAELLARVVGPTGTVYGHNPPLILERFAEGPWRARLATPPMRNVVRLDRAFDDPFPAGVRDLDQVWIVLFYHDTVWMGADRDHMNRAVFAALRPGGVYAIVDHSGRPGTGTSEAQTLHRIEEAAVRAEVERAGFQLDATSDVLRNPADPRDWNASPRTAGPQRGTSDRFTLRYKKPAN